MTRCSRRHTRSTCLTPAMPSVSLSVRDTLGESGRWRARLPRAITAIGNNSVSHAVEGMPDIDCAKPAGRDRHRGATAEGAAQVGGDVRHRLHRGLLKKHSWCPRKAHSSGSLRRAGWPCGSLMSGSGNPIRLSNAGARRWRRLSTARAIRPGRRLVCQILRCSH